MVCGLGVFEIGPHEWESWIMWEFPYVCFLEKLNADPHSGWLVRIPTSDGNVFLWSAFPSVFVVVFLMIVILTEQKEQHWRTHHTQSQVELQSN